MNVPNKTPLWAKVCNLYLKLQSILTHQRLDRSLTVEVPWWVPKTDFDFSMGRQCEEVQSNVCWSRRLHAGSWVKKGLTFQSNEERLSKPGIMSWGLKDQNVGSKREEIMAENVPGQKNELGKLKGLRENDVLMKYQSSEWRGGEYIQATNRLNFKQLVNNITGFLFKNDHSPGWGKKSRALSFMRSCL